jgi:uncharacterized metal-binding protein YceD (DUF177 family)
MANPLLDRVHPEVLAESGQPIEIIGKVGDLGRLVAIVEEDLEALAERDRPREWRDAPLDVRLRFGWLDRDRRIVAVSGRLRGRVAAVCQRCLEAFEWPLETEFRLVFSSDEDDGPEGYEAWVTDEETVRPLDLVEEAAVMALPLSPRHGSVDDCGPLAQALGGTDAEAETTRPFADLRAQMDESKE